MSDPVPPLAGRLSVVSLAAVVQLAESEQLTGRLSLPPAGHLDVYGGTIVAARFGALEGYEAAVELFIGGAEAFALEPAVVRELPELVEVLALVMEGCRLADEWPRLAPHALAPVPGVVVPEEVARLLAVGEGLPLVDAVARVGVPRGRVTDPLLACVERGEVRLVEAPAAAAPAPDYDTLLAEGRASLRRRAFDAAEAAFTLALRLRPADPVARQNLARTRTLAAADRTPVVVSGSGAA